MLLFETFFRKRVPHNKRKRIMFESVRVRVCFGYTSIITGYIQLHLYVICDCLKFSI